MGILQYVINLAVDAAPHRPGFQTHPLYVALNLILPILLGIIMAWITRFLEKSLTSLLGEKR